MTIAGATLSVAPMDADAARLGGGRPAGMQRQAPPRQPDSVPAKPQQQPNNAAQPTPAPVAPAAATAPAKRSWMAPLAGLAAGLGIAALLSHFGLGGAFANFVTMLLVLLLAFLVIRWLVRRFAPATASSPMQYSGPAGTTAALPRAPEDFASAAPPAESASRLPAGLDAQAFVRTAKMIFIRLQAANDAGHVEDLRKFTTPELFASLRMDVQERASAPQQTDVVQLDAEVADTVEEGGQWIVSVRFKGLIREQVGSVAEPFDEVWHLVKPVDGTREWAIAGITPA
jgi:predicted lipid-binding transport protein (Tim44 family)